MSTTPHPTTLTVGVYNITTLGSKFYSLVIKLSTDGVLGLQDVRIERRGVKDVAIGFDGTSGIGRLRHCAVRPNIGPSCHIMLWE